LTALFTCSVKSVSSSQLFTVYLTTLYFRLCSIISRDEFERV
jgi:hypothetical protein